ncbi:FAD/NAD(P)-binding domain-containing protein [Zopfia rhizophila CBS 207.26]|uniref:FAD/NAD(P)-binding domain-containing protein n=1 Tax=Zopfia rhizophila CBS 207.26 TaxID=1314779 RepID=A0A6A6DQ30_9PEZI|nr:FAD/NAD(P)-binding domain-containing protein [Zopfia rhizophila CBS 207.26]
MSSTPERYDTISIGSGEAGKYLCWTRASAGKRTAVIEHKWFGGSCPNYGKIGLLQASASGVDMSAVRERKRGMVKGLIEMHEDVFKGNGAELILGMGSLTHIELLELDQVPKHLVIPGGGYIGMEFAQAMRRFGAEVMREDEDAPSALADNLREAGVQFFTGTHLLVAGGRLANTENCGIDAACIALTPSGHVKVNEYLPTNVPGVFAVRDCAGFLHFTHFGSDDLRIGRGFLNNKRLLSFNKGRHGAARRTGIGYRLAKLPMAALLRTRTMDANQGFTKALVSASDDNILAMTAEPPYTSLVDLIVTYPTMCEGSVSLFGAVPPKA